MKVEKDVIQATLWVCAVSLGVAERRSPTRLSAADMLSKPPTDAYFLCLLLLPVAHSPPTYARTQKEQEDRHPFLPPGLPAV